MAQLTLKNAISSGAVILMLVTGLGLATLNLFPPTPKSLADAGLQGRSWSSRDDIDLARRVTRKQLEGLARRLDEAQRKGDLQIVWAIMPETTSLMGSWNDQPDETKASGHDCMLAALHLMKGFDAVATNTTWDRSRFNATMDGCQP